MIEIEKIRNNNFTNKIYQVKKYFEQHLNVFSIYTLFIISLLILSFLIVLEPILVISLVGITLSTIIAYKYPKSIIILTIFLGQVVQYELNEVLGINIENLSLGHFTIRLSDPLILGITITTLIKSFLYNKSIIKIVKDYGLYYFLFIFILLFQIIRNFHLYGISTFGEFRTYYQFLVFIPYLVTSLKESDDRRKVFYLLLTLSLLHIIFGFIKGGILYQFKFEAYDKWLSNYGSLALLYGIIGLFLFSKTENVNINKMITSSTFLAGMSIIIISSSRSAWLASISGLFILILLSQFKLNNLFNLLLLSPILFCFLLFLFEYSGIDMLFFIKKRLAAFIEYESDPTSSWRYTFWLSTIANVKENLILGNGLGQHFQIYIPEYKETITTSPHNIYLTILFHSGIFGLIFYLLFIINIFKKMKNKIKNYEERYILLTSMVVLFSVHFYGIAYSFEKDFFTWMYIGLGMSVLVHKNKRLYESI